MLRLGLLLLREDRLRLAEIDDDAAALEALDEAVDQFSDAAAVLLVDVLSLGLPDLLKNDLLGRLCRDAAEPLHRSRDFHRALKVSGGIHLLGLPQGNLE